MTILYCLQVTGQNIDHTFQQISSDAGITFNAIASIVEDDYGFIWFGSGNGLYYYNTSEIVKYHFDPHKEDSPPSDKIINLYREKSGRIWVCTDNGVCYFNESENSFTRLRLTEQGEYLDKPSTNFISQYSESKYLIEINSKLYSFDLNEQELEKINFDENPDISYLGMNEDKQVIVGTADGRVFISNGTVTDFRLLYSTRSGSISTLCYIDNEYWIGTDHYGIDVVSLDGKLQSRYSQEHSGDHRLPNNQITKIIQRKGGEIWVGTFGGISVINSAGIRTIKPDLHNGLPHIGIFNLYLDRNDGVWVGTWSGGLAYYNEANYMFPHIRQIRNNEHLTRNVISSFAEDSDGNIWVGSENYGLNKFNPETKQFAENATSRDLWPISRIKSIETDKYNRHWFGTFREGLWMMDKGRLRQVGDVTGIFSSILAADEGIWIGDRQEGLFFYDTNNNTIKRFRAEENRIGSISSNEIWDIFQDSNGNLWICSDFGLFAKRKNEEGFLRYYHNESASSQSRNMNYTIAEDRNGKLWIGTNGGGIDIYDPENNSFSKFRLNESIETADIYCIIKDHQDNMWFSSNQGIYAYYHRTNTLKSFTPQDGLLGNQFHPNSGFISSSGKLYFGGGNGFNVIDPEAVRQNSFVPDAFLSKLLINHRSIEEQEPKSVNSRFTAGIDRLELKYNQNSITLGFVANSFVKSVKNRFRYRIQKYQDEWNETDHGSEVSFTKIPPGEYVLEVLASNNDGIWSNTPREIQIKIYPPFWQAWYAYLFYTILFTGTLFLIIREQRFRAKSKAGETLHLEKVKFFTNVSHEFRTPLTLIISPLNNLLKKFAFDPEMADQINIVKRNADRLLRLTNQLLDFRKIELNKSELKPEKTDLVSLCRNVYDCFEFQVIEKEINCIFNSSFRNLILPVDSEKIDKVVYNLMSNSLKYSPEKGQVILSLEQKTLDKQSYANVFFTGNKFYGDALEIKVRDNGKGIRPDAIPHIFERFFVEHMDGETGTGIGLHICQEYVRMHGGHIMVTSEVGYGSTFTINIPILSEAEYEKENIIIQSHFDRLPEIEEDAPSDAGKSINKKIILFAEDNDELRIYYKKLFAAKYKVLTAKNGKQAFEIASEVIPDIVVTDVLMPGMDGMELTGKIRSTPETSHIPVILLTALSEDHHRIESMAKGANAFLTKPVDESFLMAKIENIFREREALKKIYGDQDTDSKVIPAVKVSFVNQAEQIIENNLRNPSFEISEFASQLSISKSSLQRKIKAATNLNPSEFIRDYRLTKAIELIKQGNLNIDEIALLVGFNSTSYFIRTFKNKYGKTPSAFKSDLPKDQV